MWWRKGDPDTPVDRPPEVSVAELIYSRFELPYGVLEASPKNKESVNESQEESSDLSHHASEDDAVTTEDSGLREIQSSRAPSQSPRASDDKSFSSYVGTWAFEKPDEHYDANVAASLKESLEDLGKKYVAERETYSMRLDKLKAKRIKPDSNETRTFEKTVTQPYVNGVLRTCLGILLQEPTPSVTEESMSLEASVSDTEAEKRLYDKNSSLYLYTEAKAYVDDGTKHANTVERSRAHARNPDAAFFQQGVPVDGESIFFGKTAREIGMILSVDAKRILDNKHAEDALVECERDFVSHTFKAPSMRTRKGYSIITDGVDWYFLRMAWLFDKKLETWSRRIEMSSRISFTDTETFANWFVFVFQESLRKEECRNDMFHHFPAYKISERVWRWSQFKRQKREIFSLTLSTVFKVGGRSAVSAWESSIESGKMYVLKQVVTRHDPERQKELADYQEHEIDILRTLANSDGIVSIAHIVPYTDGRLWLEYAGDPLERLDICGRRGRQLALIVKRDIWEGALPALNTHQISHGDIHQSNVLISFEGAKVRAVLADFESARKYGDDFKQSPVRLKHQFKEAKKEVDEVAVLALLKCLWTASIDDFGTMGKLVTSIGAGGKTMRSNIVTRVMLDENAA